MITLQPKVQCNRAALLPRCRHMPNARPLRSQIRNCNASHLCAYEFGPTYECHASHELGWGQQRAAASAARRPAPSRQRRRREPAAVLAPPVISAHAIA